MALFTPQDWSFTEKALELITTNPFDPNWGKKGRDLLGLPFPDAPEATGWKPGANLWGPHSIYSEEPHKEIAEVAERIQLRLRDGASGSEKELGRYELLALYRLYCQYGEWMDRLIDTAVRSQGKRSSLAPNKESLREVRSLWDSFQSDHQKLFAFGNFSFPVKYKPPHVFACFFLFRRAFYHIFFNIIGTSPAIAKLRCAVWESIVTHDLLGWMHGLHQRMLDIPTLITGPSGTGKERVAEAIGRSPYIPFDPEKKAFALDFREAFRPVNLSALPPLLIEAELFGHVKGAFAGAIRDRIGRLEECPPIGAVFLDEIGELTEEVQVKLLRVLQERCFQPVGSNENKEFRGKILAATNRDLAAAMQAGRFRADFYYRLCADQIETPSLREQLADRCQDLPLFVKFICGGVAGADRAEELAQPIVAWIERHLPGYGWPGNFRELEQCVRSYTIRKSYHPVRSRPSSDSLAEACDTLATAVLEEQMTYKEIQRRLFTLVRRGTPSAKEAARLLGLRDYRTLQARLKETARSPYETEPRV